MEVGLAGLGRMGKGMARSLLRAGHRLAVWNRTRAAADALAAEGATVAASSKGSDPLGVHPQDDLHRPLRRTVRDLSRWPRQSGGGISRTTLMVSTS